MDRIVYTGPEYSIKILQQRLGNMFKIVCVEPTPEDLLPEFEKCTIDEGVDVMRIIEACRISSNEKKVVVLNEI